MPQKVDTDLDTSGNVIRMSFLRSQPQWFAEPVLDTWDTNQSIQRVLEHVSALYHQWQNLPPGHFSPSSDPLWAETAKVLRDAGLPWHNNNLNMPEDIDKSWPFHFKDFERHVVLTKGARVDDKNAAGYVCNWTETNQYGIRAIQQELRRRIPHQQPLLVAGCIESKFSQSASQLLGLELLQLDCPWKDARDILEERTNGNRPIIAVTTLGNGLGEMDDFDALRQLSDDLPIYLHVDASRTFDYTTTMSPSDRKRLGLPRLLLRHPFENTKTRRGSEPTVAAATIVAAGMNNISPPPTTILKPRSLGTPFDEKVEYVRGTDSTLAGSRDALGPLLMCLQELRFGSSGIRQIYSRCQSNREALQETLKSQGVKVEAPPGSLDLVIKDVHLSKTTLTDMGLKRLKNDSYLATVQPSVTKQDVTALTGRLIGSKTPPSSPLSWLSTRPNEFPIAEHITGTIKSVVDHFRIVGKTSGGYL